MKLIKPLAGILLLAVLSMLGSTKLGSVPPVMDFVNPYQGFWQNAELENDSTAAKEIQLEGLEAYASILMDSRGVPHVFAENDHDLYFLQGYLAAKDRLWQMEFQTHAAAGRISEIVGEKALQFDLEQRRIGMTYAAEKAMELIEQNPVSMMVLEAYTDGVNQYIAELDEISLPLEYKLLDYKPEQWSPFKSALLLKYMAKMLNGTERDRSNTAALKLLGEDLFWVLFPDQTHLEDPIAPGFKVPQLTDDQGNAEGDLDMSFDWDVDHIQPGYIGSNNWAVHGSRTESGNAILCNDPHLKLSLPSIWYEIQLNGPDVNCYGVSLPGSPGITIGFNEKVAWGVTNAGRDVKDYYAIELDRSNYRIGDSLNRAVPRIEEVKVRNSESIIDTVWYTAYGPISFSEDGNNLALRWLAHDASNELMTFHELNRASSFQDYSDALSHYSCPGQNFVYADVHDTIAIWQHGKFKLKHQGYGKFILNGSDSSNLVESFIPKEHNPHMVNPERGFVSSANQAAVDSTYPYYVSGVYEEFRNRTINRFLRNDSAISLLDVQDLQLSNYNLLAEEALPLMLALLDTTEFQNKEYEMLALNELRKWNYSNDAGLIAPTVFEIWWDEFKNILWDEFNEQHWDQDLYYRYSWEQLAVDGKAKVDMRDKRYVYPMNKVAIDLLLNNPEHPIFDHHATNNKTETAKDVVYDSFYWTAMKFGDIIKYEFNAPHWGHYQGTTVQHLLRLDAFSSEKLFVGGSEHAPNATTSTHGPSWRMIVELKPEGVEAYGVLPGGQSGNPGSKNYINSLENWTKGEYHRLQLLKDDSHLEEGWVKYEFNLQEE